MTAAVAAAAALILREFAAARIFSGVNSTASSASSASSASASFSSVSAAADDRCESPVENHKRGELAAGAGRTD